MKKIFGILLMMFMFLGFNIVKAETTYSYSCDYTYNGVTIRYTVSNLEQSKIKYAQELYNTQSGSSWNDFWQGKDSAYNKYVKIQYMDKNGQLKDYPTSKNNGVTDYMGHDSNKGALFPKAGLVYSFIKNSIRGNTIVCPTIYKSNVDSSGVSLTYEKRTCNDTSGITWCEGDNDPSWVNNTQMSASMNMCKNDQTGQSATSCDNIINQESLYDDDEWECEYSNGNGDNYLLIYDSKANHITIKNLGGSFSVKTYQLSQLESDFKAEFEKGKDKRKCPKINCKYQPFKKILHIMPKSLSQFTPEGETTQMSADDDCGKNTSNQGTKIDPSTPGDAPDDPNLHFREDPKTCAELVGPNAVKLIKFAIRTIRILAAIAAIVIGMTKFIPAIMAKDAGELKKVAKSVVMMLIVLVLILLIPTLARIIGDLFEYDTTCFF